MPAASFLEHRTGLKRHSFYGVVNMDIKIELINDLPAEVWQEFLEGVLSANLKEQIPADDQERLLRAFVEAGLISK